MTEFTPNFNLPYPSPGDRPCDFADQWCDFTQVLTGVLDGFQETVDRTVPVIPMAILKLSEPVDIATGGPFVVPFDTVVLDTAGWTDADVNPTIISPDIAAIVSLVGNGTSDLASTSITDHFGVEFISVGVTLGGLTGANDSTLSQNGDDIRIGHDVAQGVFQTSGTLIPGVTGLALNTTAGVSILDIGLAHFTVYWHADV